MEDNEQKMSFKIEDNKLKMEISFEDLKELFYTYSNNYDGEQTLVEIKPKREKDFILWLINYLKDISLDNENVPNWGYPFETAFQELVCSDEDFLIEFFDNNTEEEK